MANWFNFFPVLMILAAMGIILLFDDWRRCIAGLAILYLGIFILLIQIWPLTLSAVKLITGWMAAVVLALNLPKTSSHEEEPVSKRIFMGMALVMIWVLAFLISKSISSAFQISPEIAFSALAIFGSGLIQLGMKAQPFLIIVAILTVFAGFELLYASVENSVLINGLLSLINLLIAFIGSYFTGVSGREDRL